LPELLINPDGKTVLSHFDDNNLDTKGSSAIEDATKNPKIGSTQ